VVCLLLASWCPVAGAAQQPVAYTTLSGLSFSVPSILHPTPVPRSLDGPWQLVEHVFSDAGAEPLQLFVVSSPARAGELLPPDTEAVRQDYARGVVTGASRVWKTLELHDVSAGDYDPTRGAFVLKLRARGPSRAKRMLDEPDQGPVWTEVRKAGHDPTLLRCFLSQLLAGEKFVDEARTRNRAASVAQRCGVSQERLMRFAQSAGASEFAPSVSSLSAIAFFTRSATVTFYVLAAGAREREGDALAATLWSGVAVAPEARLPVSLLDELPGSPASDGRLLGVAFGSLLSILSLGGLLAWGCFKWLRVSAAKAVGIALSALNALALLGFVVGHAVSATAWVQLASYLLGSALFYRPLTKWLAARRSGPAHPAPAPDLRTDQRGLATIEYAVLLLVIIVGAIASWRHLGNAMVAQLETGQNTFSQTLGRAARGSDDDIARAPPGASSVVGVGIAPQAPTNTQTLAARSTSDGAGARPSHPITPPVGSHAGSERDANEKDRGVLERAKDYLVHTPGAQYALGIAAGVLQGYTPAGFLAPSPYASSKPFELGRGLGQMAAGVSETVAGMGMVGGGGALTGVGAVATFSPVSPAGVGMVAVGVPTTAAGALAVANGVGATAAGYGTIIHAMSMADDPPGSSQSSSGGGGGGDKPANAGTATPTTEAPNTTASQGQLTPVNGRINVGGGLEKGSQAATNLNPIVPGTGGPTKGIPNHVPAGFEQIGSVFKPGSATSIISNRLPYQTVNWTQSAQGAYKVLAPGGRVSLNVWTKSAQEAQEITSAFKAAGFKEVKSIGSGAGTMIFGVK
jgi:Flp pilus assembly pilin Flp